MTRAVYCEKVKSYVAADGFTCPPGCRLLPPRKCALTDPNALNATTFYPHCFSEPYTQEECELCPHLDECCLEAIKK
jgi:hypothetical protein